MTRAAQVVRLRIQREEVGIGRNAVVEPVDERLEERHAAGGLVDGLLLHDAQCTEGQSSG